ncbi:uncharacterized protein LOC133176450 [Saccostrea echinata]|uniref:uncharacterized protein LOC133176450 n=1 Tax=Saccostrea echinata TaxID=191078 RepID=UPI002A804018|nr:uncharacterized protein LOC133176450 [Saccostrea echinata]
MNFREGLFIVFYPVGIISLSVVFGDHDTSKRETRTQNATLYDSIYGYNEFKRLYPTKETTLCYDSSGVNINGSVFMNFTCPLPDQDKGLTDCCNNTCCRPKIVKKSKGSDSTVAVAVVVIAVCAVVISFCAVLYYCYLQRRPGIRDGKLVWIKRKKKKNVYEQGGASSGTGNAADDNEMEDVLAVVYSTDENGHVLHHSHDTPHDTKNVEKKVFLLPEELVEKIEMDMHEGSCPRSRRGSHSWLS